MIHIKISPLTFVFILFVKYVWSYSTGSPQTACQSLRPNHQGIEPQRGLNPYTVHATKSGNKIKVTISSTYSESFQGFIIQARSAKDKNRMVDGKFSITPGLSKTIDCGDGVQNTLTHTSKEEKYEIVSEWTSNSQSIKDIIFRATVAKTFQDFWIETDSSPVKLSGSDNQKQKQSMGSDNMYFDCSVNKGCFGYPLDCVARENCNVLVSYVDSDEGVLFTMESALSENNYMAMGLSFDELMGDDSVTECFIENGRVVVQHSWNERRGNTPLTLIPEGRYEWKIKNGMVSCTWNRPYLTEAGGKSFNLLNNTYYILVAKGPVYDGRVARHDNRLASQEAVNFTAYDKISGAKAHNAVKIHGAFMVTGWVLFVSSAILIARHFKNAWENKMVFGVKIWFAIHRGFMIVALIFIIIAFIVIFVYKNGWNYQTSNPHAVLGCISTILCVLQPVMAAFRPPPDHPKRPVFNWCHFAVGNSAQILAIITIFFAVSLEASGLKESFYWVMGVFVVVYYCIHLVFQLHSYSVEHKKTSDVKMQELGSGQNINMQNNQTKTFPANVFKVLFLGMYGIFLTVIMLTLYSLIGTA